MSLPDRSHAWYVRQQRLSKHAVNAASTAWMMLNTTDLTGSWKAGTGAYLTRVVTGSQAAAAAGSTVYVSTLVTDAGLEPDPQGKVNATRFSGRSATGRDLSSLLYLAVIDVKRSIAAGAGVDQAMQGGLFNLLNRVNTEVLDASRTSVQVATTAEPSAVGFIRETTSPNPCPLCLDLQGNFYAHSAGFERHAGCDCQNVPVVEQGQAPDTTQSDAPGADRATVPGGDDENTQRPSVAQIFRAAGDDRTNAVDLFHRFGYLR